MLGRRVSQVDLDALDQGSERGHRFALAAARHTGQHVGCQLQVPGVVELAGLHDCAARSRCVTAALERERSEGRLGRFPVVRVGHHLDNVVRTEFLDHEWAGSDRVEVFLGAARCLVAKAILELGALDDRRRSATKHVIGIGLGRLESDPYRQVIGGHDLVHRSEGG